MFLVVFLDVVFRGVLPEPSGEGWTELQELS